MADEPEFRSTGPVAAKIIPALPQYVDQYMGIDFAVLDNMFQDGGNAATDNAINEDKHTNPNRRPISIVKEIQQQFINDPKTAVKDNVGLHFNPEYLDTLQDKVDHIAEARRRQNMVADMLWKDADYEFLQMVMGITRNTTLMNREVTVTKDARMPSLQLLQSNATGDASYLRGHNVRGFWAYNHEQQQQQANAPQGIGQINQAELDRRVTAKKEELQILENVDRLMEEPMVSGEIQMSSVMYGAVNLALVMGLVVKNKDKYKNKTRFDFYPDHAVKVMFANVIRAYIGNTYKEFSDSYSKVVDLPRTHEDITTSLNILDNNCVWNENRKCFVLASEKDTELAKEKKRQKLMDAYDL